MLTRKDTNETATSVLEHNEVPAASNTNAILEETEQEDDDAENQATTHPQSKAHEFKLPAAAPAVRLKK